jgi:hypothetical protein
MPLSAGGGFVRREDGGNAGEHPVESAERRAKGVGFG